MCDSVMKLIHNWVELELQNANANCLFAILYNAKAIHPPTDIKPI